MPSERELKLEAPPGFRLPDLSDLRADVQACPVGARTLVAVYHDTADLRLARSGCTLRHRSNDGWTLKLPAASKGALLERQELRFRGGPGRVPPDALDLASAWLRGAEIGPVARLRTVRETLELLDGDGKRLVLVENDEVSVVDGRRVTGRFREVEVELVGEPSAELVDAIVERLHAAGAGGSVAVPKLARALGAVALRPPDLVARPPAEGASAGEVFTAAFTSAVLRLLQHDAGVRLGRDPEQVHQARVATRRMRSLLRTFVPVVDPAWAEALRADLREPAALLGAVRDADVLLQRLQDVAADLAKEGADEGGAAQALVRSLQREREGARRRLLESMRAPAYAALLQRLIDAARMPSFTAEAQRPAADVLLPSVRSAWERLEQAVAELPEPAPEDESLHRVRILTKRARYAVEAVAGVSDGRARRLVRRLAALQDVLGELQDANVARAWLVRAAESRPRKHVFTAGLIAGLERRAADDARKAWRRAWSRVEKRKLWSWL